MAAYKHINKYNYEAWFLDFHEGKLTVDEQEQLFAFVEQNPELAEQLFDYHEPRTAGMELDNGFKDFLKKPLYEHAKEITTDNLNDFLIAETEGLLTDKQVRMLNEYIIQHPAAEQDRKLYALTRQEPDYSVVFENKQSLKRGNRSVIARIGWQYWTSAAAILLAAVIIYFPKNTNTSVALNEPEKQTQQPTGNKQSAQPSDNKQPSTDNKKQPVIPSPLPKKNIVKERPIFIKEAATEKIEVAVVETKPARKLKLLEAHAVQLPLIILPLPEGEEQMAASKPLLKGNRHNLMMGVNRITGIAFFTHQKDQLKVNWMNVAKATARFIKHKTGRSISIGSSQTMTAFK